MLWLIWIALMLLVPALAGVHVWFETHEHPAEIPAPSAISAPSDVQS